jgi:hypothetical protein
MDGFERRKAQSHINAVIPASKVNLDRKKKKGRSMKMALLSERRAVRRCKAKRRARR